MVSRRLGLLVSLSLLLARAVFRESDVSWSSKVMPKSCSCKESEKSSRNV